MNKEEYANNLNHPLWKQKREEVFDHYGRICMTPGCGSTTYLEVHHKSYASNKMPWEYPMENFKVLCEKCHKKNHNYIYTEKKCESCRKVISEKFTLCLDCHNQKVEKLKNDKTHLEKKIKDLSIRLQNETMVNNESDNPKIKQLQNKISDIARENESLASIIKSLKEKLQEEIEAAQTIKQKEINILRDKLSKASNDKKATAETIKELEIKIKHKIDIINNSKQKEINILRDRLTKASNDKKTTTETIEELEMKLNLELHAIHNSKEGEINNLKEIIQKLSSDKETIETKLIDFEERKKQINEENERIIEEKLEMEKGIKDLEKARKEDTEIVKSQLSSLKNLAIGIALMIIVISIALFLIYQKPAEIISSNLQMKDDRTQQVEKSAPSITHKTFREDKQPKKSQTVDTGNIKDESSSSSALVPMLKTGGVKGRIPTVSVLSINKINKEMIKGLPVSIEGKIDDRRDHAKGHVFLKVSDETGRIMVAIFANKGIDATQMQVGSSFKFTGSVNLYKDELEIIPNNKSDISPLRDATQISISDIGKKITFTAKVMSLYNHKDGHKLLTVLIQKTDQEMKVPIFSNLSYDDENLIVKSTIQITGEVSIYKGALQVVPAKADDIKVVMEGNKQ